MHLAPENAAILFDLIRKHYRGPVPRFAYNEKTQTMSNQGVFMHTRSGALKMADGYRVLVTDRRLWRRRCRRRHVLTDFGFGIRLQAWPVTSHRMMMIGSGMPIAHKSTERMVPPNRRWGGNGAVRLRVP